MTWAAKPLSAVVVLAIGACCGLLVAQAAADDAGTAKRAPATLDQQINQAVGSGGQSSSDLDARVRDLESTRTAIDQQKKPTVSLSVSGWVDQQVQYNMK
ncbi:MAG: hypothetical protein JSR78_13950 [Proteobacteria bacterium]|nr:hypothetical protein [Pseudomonadota bacterium]